MSNKYVLIPNDVKLDTRIPPGAKILYGDILYLSLKSGYCFASNKYFGELYNVHVNSISSWIKSLKQFKYIYAEYTKDENGRSLRRIYPTKKCGSKHKKLWEVHTENCEHMNKKYKYKRKTKVVI